MKSYLIILFLCALSFVTAICAQEPAQTTPPANQDKPPAKPLTPRIRVGGSVAASMLKHKVKPIYPQEARAQRLRGTVRLHVIIGFDGKVKQLEVVSGDPVLAQAALDAVRQWQYRPTKLNGEPVEVDTTVDVVFSLRD